jgi:hypothetical protein
MQAVVATSAIWSTELLNPTFGVYEQALQSLMGFSSLAVFGGFL